MARSRRAAGPAISLFSFQDIITSVTAILILMVLILTLELISRLRRGGASVADVRSAGRLRVAANELARNIRELEQELDARSRSAEAVATFSADELGRSAEEYARQAAGLQEAIADIGRQVERAASERRAAESELVEIEKQRPEVEHILDQAEDIAAATKGLIDRNTEASARLSMQEARTRQAGRLPTTLVFNAVEGDAPKPRLVEVSGAGVRLLDGEDRGDVHPWPLFGVHESFSSWLAALDRQREYVVIILRPSGMSRLDQVRAVIEGKSLGVGLELVGENMTVVVRE